MKCSICGLETEDKDEIVIISTKNIKDLKDGFYSVCKTCIVNNILKPNGYKDFGDYLKRYWGIR